MTRLLVAFNAGMLLAACAPRETAAHRALREMRFERVSIRAEPHFGRPCDFTEPYAVRFEGNRNGHRYRGVACASDERFEAPTLRDLRMLDPLAGGSR